MGVMVEKKSWDLGADIYTPGKPGDALRSLKDPASIPNPLKPGEGYPIITINATLEQLITAAFILTVVLTIKLPI